MNLLIAAISGSALVTAIVWLVIAGLIFWVLDWGLKRMALGEPINKVAQVILILAVVIIVINALLTLVGKPFIQW